MSATNSGLHFLSGIALYFGTAPMSKASKPSVRKVSRFQQPSSQNYTPLTERQKKELLDSIRHDDWFE